MRTTGLALCLLLLCACGARDEEEEGERVPLLHMRGSSEESVREAVQVLAKAGIATELAAVCDLDPDEIPDWVDAEDGWLVLGKEEDRERAGKVLSDWYAELRKNTPPPAPKPEPLALGTRRDVSEKEVAGVQAELARRRTVDQAVRVDRARHGEMGKVDADNTAYLKGVVTDVGWIDVERFGQAAADAAFLLVQHSGDLSLMLAALPEIEKDVRAGRLSGQNFALLYDRTQLMSGGKQRYGSQIRENEDGDLEVFRLEDPDHVDERRKELGMRPLREYLAMFGREVKIAR